MFPDIPVDNVRYDLLRTGSVELTSNKILERGFLDAPPPAYYTLFPREAAAARPASANTTTARSTVKKQDTLISRYQLQDRVTTEEAIEHEQVGGKAVWEDTAEKREASLRERKAQMILAARQTQRVPRRTRALEGKLSLYKRLATDDRYGKSNVNFHIACKANRASALPSFSSPTPSVSSSSALSSYYTPPTSTPGSTSPAPSSTGTATPSNSLHLAQIKKNLARLKEGILEIEASVKGKEKEEKGKGVLEATRLLRVQYQRMRGMLGPEVEGVDSLQEEPPSNTKMEPPPSLPLPPSTISQYPAVQSPEPSPFTPYTDDPNDGGETDNGILLQEQRRMMNGPFPYVFILVLRIHLSETKNKTLI
ncbi:hypothetical protein H0H93_008590 [Arthromyces matolae]|nr:hypothetical protein H0H93_008590 [Arthromyces matolae]